MISHGFGYESCFIIIKERRAGVSGTRMITAEGEDTWTKSPEPTVYIPLPPPVFDSSILGETFQIYMEGYKATGEQAGASYVGQANGNTFKEACQNFYTSNPDRAAEYDAKTNAVWGCSLYDNIESAQEFFG